jgi:hypothetical protein
MSKTLKAVSLFVILGVAVICATANYKAGKKLTIEGSFVGYDEMLPLANLTSAPHLEILVVRVTKPSKIVERSPYIKVLYEHMQNRASLPEEMFDSKQEWRLKLTRADQSEENCEGPVLHFKSTTGAESERVPNGELPCYILRSGDFRLSGKRK